MNVSTARNPLLRAWNPVVSCYSSFSLSQNYHQIEPGNNPDEFITHHIVNSEFSHPCDYSK